MVVINLKFYFGQIPISFIIIIDENIFILNRTLLKTILGGV